jgi:hypothetical protein
MTTLAQYDTTNTTTGSAVGSTTPGVPNTGVGGDPTNLLAILGIAAVVVIAGGAYLLWEGGQQRP